MLFVEKEIKEVKVRSITASLYCAKLVIIGNV